MKDTFTRLVLFAQRWARGERALRITSLLAGILQDAEWQGALEAMRMLIPLDGTMPDALPQLFKRFGLPPYAPSLITYTGLLARLQDFLATHESSGSAAQMRFELIQLGIIDAQIVATADGFKVATSDAEPTIIGDDWVIGDGKCIGATIAGSTALTTSVEQMADYFKPASDKFEDIEVP